VEAISHPVRFTLRALACAVLAAAIAERASAPITFHPPTTAAGRIVDVNAVTVYDVLNGTEVAGRARHPRIPLIGYPDAALMTYDGIILGAGHNSLVLQAYLGPV